jgi:hypothetical protein
MSTISQDQYRSASRLAFWASTLCIASALIAAVAALLDAYQLALLSVSHFGGTIPPALAEAQDSRQRVVAVFEFGSAILAVVLFLMWVYRTNKNAWSLGARRMQYSPGWSVGWFFVPIANLVVPYNVVRELWETTSLPAADRWSDPPRCRFIVAWWAVWVANALIQYSALRVVLGHAKLAQFTDPWLNTRWLDHLSEFFWGRLVSDLAGIGIGILTAVLIIRLTNLQQFRHTEVRRSTASQTEEGQRATI